MLMPPAPFAFWIQGDEVDAARDFITSLSIKTPDHTTRVSHLSGGNQQKVIFSKWLNKHPKVLILDEPTRGLDIGAKREIANLITGTCK